MKTRFLSFAVIALLPVFGCKKSAESERPVPAVRATTEAGLSVNPPFQGGRKTSFQEVTTQLDPGGSLFLYVAADQWLRGLSTKLSEVRDVLLSLPGPAVRDRDEINGAFDLLARLVQSSGMEDVTGVGVSAAPVAPELYRTKLILHHANGAGQGFLASMFGPTPHALHNQTMLPRNTVFAAFGDLDVAQLWQVLERELSQSGLPPAEEAVGSWPKMFEAKTKIPWAQLLESLGGELGIALTLDDTQMIQLPGGGNGRPIEIPAPALLVALKVKNDLLFEHLAAQLKANPNAVLTEESGLKMCATSLPLPLPIRLELTVASSGDYFYFATSSELVRAVQAVRQGKQPGLKSSREFQSLITHLPSEGNQFIYLSRRLGETLADLQQQAARAGGIPAEQLTVIRRLLGTDTPTYTLSVGAHTATGWHWTSVGNQDSASAVLLMPTVGVTAVAAGMLLPALAKAKSRAQTISSVNNLKQLGLAARQFAVEHRGIFPQAQTWCDDLQEVLGSPKVFKAANDSDSGACSYGYNAKLSGITQSRVHPQTVLFFETESGWNQHGGPELLLQQPRSVGVYIFGFADGSVQQVQPARIGSLRWEP